MDAVVTGRWDFFVKTENKNFNPENEDEAGYYSFDIDFVSAECFEELNPLDILAEVLAHCYNNGMPRGSARAGCYEVQCDFGIFSHKNGARIDLTTARKRLNVVFKTWEQIEAESK